MNNVRKDPLEDTFVRTWDALLAVEERGDSPGDPSVTAVISEFTRMFDSIRADDHFLSNLELQLFGSGGVGDAASSVAQNASKIAPLPTIPSVSSTPTRRRPIARNLINQFSLAALLAIILAGIVVIYFTDRNGDQTPSGLPTANETPITVNRQSYYVMLDSTVDSRSLLSEDAPSWDEAYFANLMLEPGASISTDNPHIRCCDGLHVITVVTGTLSVQMSQPISVNQADGTVLVSVGSVSLKPGDSAIYQGEMTAQNQEKGPARFLVGGAYESPPEPPAPEPAAGLTVVSEATTSIKFDPGDVLSSVDIDQITVHEGAVVQLDITAKDAILLVTSGGELRLGTSQTDPEPVELSDAFAISNLEPGRYWLSIAESNPVFIYILRVGPDLVLPRPE